MRALFISAVANIIAITVAYSGELVLGFQDRQVSESGYAVFVLPGEAVEFELRSAGSARFAASVGEVAATSDSRWRWVAPSESGSFGSLSISELSGTATLQLNVFVLIPASEMKNGRVGDFRIDNYPSGSPRPDVNTYVPPLGFVEVTEANRELNISPHFQIGQFVSKQEGDWPKYVAPGPKLYAKLEQLLYAVRDQGFAAETLHIMSGYRTPYYNRAIGNVQFSRHIYGDAADVFVDIDNDVYMDDLNRDGVVNVTDAATMAKWLESISDDPALEPLEGGLGVYDSTQYHGPFIHVDSRGHVARWGLREF
jgi:hypothetical protein